MSYWKTVVSLAVMIGAAMMLTMSGCKTTHQARSVEKSGFLVDYSQLSESSGAGALLTYVNPNTDWRKYHKILMDPIKVYPGVGDSFFRTLSADDLQKMVNYFDASIREKLGTDYTFVDEPGPDVMRLRIALTEANPSNVPRDLVSSVVPIGAAISALKTVTLGRATGVGSASAEIDLIDTQTEERLGAAVDRRIGNKYTGRMDKFNRWRTTQSAFDYWAEQLKARLAELRSRPTA